MPGIGAPEPHPFAAFHNLLVAFCAVITSLLATAYVLSDHNEPLYFGALIFGGVTLGVGLFRLVFWLGDRRRDRARRKS